MYVGIDIGGTKTLIAFGDADGHVTERYGFDTHDDFASWYDHALSLLAPFAGRIQGMGIGSIGPVDFRTGIILNPPAKQRWRNVPIVEHFKADLGLDRVFLDNDCNPAVLGEVQWGAAQGKDPVVYYTVSTGVGTGVLINGAVLHGRMDTEGGHQIVRPGGSLAPCGHRGCLEGTVSGGAIHRQTGRFPAELNDPDFWDGIAEALAIAMINTTVLLSPEVIVIGGGLVQKGDLLFAPLRRHTERLMADYLKLPPLDEYIVPAGLGQDSVLLGSLRLAVVGFRGI